MDFSQKKPTRAEWESIEIPISENEKKIVQMICDGFSNLAIRNNPHLSLFTFIKITPSKEMEYALFQKYFEPSMENILKHASFPDAQHQNNQQQHQNQEKDKAPKTIQKILQTEKENKQIHLKTADKLRIQNLDENIQKNHTAIFEFRLLELCQSLMAPLLSNDSKPKTKNTEKNPQKKNDKVEPKMKTQEKQVKPSIFYLYTLIQLKKSSISHTNTYVLRFVDYVIQTFQTDHSMKYILLHSYECIEKNPYLFQYEDKSLFSHQKDLFQTFPASNRERSKLVLYIAPTGTGKTLSPIGLTEGHRVIFVCVARHIGFALAQTAVSVGKKIAFAFGCETADDIRLHNYSAKVFLKNRRTGGIGKIDHSVGDKVELMICDLQSYIPAMHYMLAFNQASDCITFWDEPTITLDVPLCASPDSPDSPEGGGLGFGMSFSSGNLQTEDQNETEIETERVEKKKTVPEMMKRLWNENRIPKMVLSCATLPKEEEILPMLADFRSRFDDAEIKTISSVDCRKSIAIINSQGYAVLPHTLFTDYRELMECVQYCEEDLTVTRYFDLREIIRFFTLLRDHQFEFWSEIDLSKEEMHKLGMKEVKQHYLNCLKMIPEEDWQIWQERFAKHSVARFSANTTTNNSQTQTQNSLRKIQSTSATDVESQHGKPLSKIHSVDGSLMNFSSHISQTKDSAPVANPFAGILFSTHDAHTLTDGPTLYLAENVEKVGKFCISQANISSAVFQSIQAKIAHNDALAKQINEFETQLAAESAKKNASLGDEEAAKNGGESKNNGKGEKDNQTMELLRDKISLLRSQICNVSLDSKYIPNHTLHLQIFAPTLASDNPKSGQETTSKPFYCPLSEECVRQIMALDVESWMKLLLLMGIGIFPQTSEGRASEAQFQYLELIKGLANEQKLFLIIANSDYIYGTNYQFCHGILGKDLADMTQQKQKQAMGRIGRFNVQQEYTVRFRNDDLIRQLWMRPVRNIEAENMCFLFS
jgi:hypothetical protein